MKTGKMPLAALAGLVALFSLTQTQAPEKSKHEEMISVEALRPEKVRGLLGQPLGTVVRVTGESVAGDSTLPRTLAGKTILKIETVNGKRLEKPVYFPITRGPSKLAEPANGERFDYWVHEFGSFDGVVIPPKELGIETPDIAHDGFWYRPEIVIHKSNSASGDSNR